MQPFCSFTIGDSEPRLRFIQIHLIQVKPDEPAHPACARRKRRTTDTEEWIEHHEAFALTMQFDAMDRQGHRKCRGMRSILVAALYEYAASGRVPDQFDGDLLKAAFRPK